MNESAWLVDPAWIERLGWTLLHSWWQIAAVTALYAGAAPIMQRNSAQARYALGCAALMAMSILPVVTFFLLSNERAPSEVSVAIVAEQASFTRSHVAPTEFSFDPPSKSASHAPLTSREQAGDAVARDLLPRVSDWRLRLAAVLPWLSAGWLVGVLVFSLRPMLGLVIIRRLRTRGVSAAPSELEQIFADLARRLGLQSTLEVALSTIVAVPTVLGYLRPLVLLPAASLSGLSTQQWELILAHELAHIRRHDYLANALQTVVETLLFYHPGMWWVSAQVRAERENCCDDIAVALCGNRAAYVGALLTLEQNRPPSVFVLAATGGPLLQRARRLLSPAPAKSAQPTSLWLAGLVPLAAVAVLLVVGGAIATGRGVDRRAADSEQPAVIAIPKPPPAAPMEVTEVAAHFHPDDKQTQPTDDAPAKAEAESNELELEVTVEDDARVPLKIELLDQYSRMKKTWEEKSPGRVHLDLPELQTDNYRLEISSAGYATLKLGLKVSKDGVKATADQLTLYRRRYAILRYTVNTIGGRELTGPDVKQERVAVAYGSVPDLHGDWMIQQNADTPTLSFHRMQQGNGFALPPEDISYDEIDIAPEADQYRAQATVAEKGMILLNRIIGNGPDLPHYAKILIEDITETRPQDTRVIDSLLPPTRFPQQAAARKITAPKKRTSGEIALTVDLEDNAAAQVKVELHNSAGRRNKTWTQETPGQIIVKLPELEHDTYSLIVSSAGHSPQRLPVQVSEEGINPIEATVELFRPRYVVLRYAINTVGERNLTGENVRSGRIALSAGKLPDLDDWTVQQQNGAVWAHVVRVFQNTGFAPAEEGKTFEQMEVAPPNDDYTPTDFAFAKGQLLYNRVVSYRPEGARYAKLQVEDVTEARPQDLSIVEPRQK